jgi:hypothetical protein
MLSFAKALNRLALQRQIPRTFGEFAFFAASSYFCPCLQYCSGGRIALSFITLSG